MIGYAYLDLDTKLIYKTQRYIDEVDPGFFTQNRSFILRHWKFNTEDRSSMVRLITAVQDLLPTNNGTVIKLFLQSINYHPDNLRVPDANKIQSN